MSDLLTHLKSLTLEATEQPEKRRQMGQREYLLERGTCCPWCRKSKISPKTLITRSQLVPTCAQQTMRCENCGGEWMDSYELEGYYTTLPPYKDFADDRPRE